MAADLFKVDRAVLASAESNTLGIFNQIHLQSFYFSVRLSKMKYDKVFVHKLQAK